MGENESGIFLRQGLDRFWVICPSCQFVAGQQMKLCLRAKQISSQAAVTTTNLRIGAASVRICAVNQRTIERLCRAPYRLSHRVRLPQENFTTKAIEYSNNI
ncbi:hypothetical protein [Bradyrhizobium algeriense]|uniref:hypothetical protein n=1 Tax=Bradyrhizobium algeriense TaxID=634784 RepID=UPI0011AE9BEA|nr:hypothetical protein [Bradyrhizobium algeriense]